MRVHWMTTSENDSLVDLKKTAEKAHECNYYSILLVYHSLISDYWIKCANTINLDHKFKYLLAIRTYAISPEYFVMMYKAFNEIQKNRIMFNIVAGDIHDSESSIENIVSHNEDFDTTEKRVEYTSLWMQKMLSLLPPKDVPEIVMSGLSKKTLESAACYADYNLVMIDNYLDNPDMFKNNSNKMVCAAVTIADSYEEALNFVDNLPLKHQKRWTIFGTEQDVKNKILEAKRAGATDIMLRAHNNDPNSHLVHQFVKKHKGVIE